MWWKKRKNEKVNSNISSSSSIEKDIERLKETKIELEKSIEGLIGLLKEDIDKKEKIEKEISDKKIELQGITDKITVVNDALEFESYGLYEPKYRFCSSDEYKEHLNEIRNRQKQMIKNKTAWICYREWTVNNSTSNGKKAIDEIGKVIIRAFNASCEASISAVRFSNIDRCEKRIESACEQINKNNIMSIYISDDYKKLKMEELYLAYEFEKKKQEEREKIREQREIEKENALVQKELEEERKRIEKEQCHYENEAERIKEQIKIELDAEKKRQLEDRIGLLYTHLDDLEERLKTVDYREANQRAGYVYVISNIGSFGEGIYKIGMTRRLEPMDRIDELGNASVPFKFDTHAIIFSDDAPALETSLHNAFSPYRVNMVNGRKEFFKVPLEMIKEEIKKHKDINAEFQDVPMAEQYRESQRLWKEQ